MKRNSFLLLCLLCSFHLIAQVNYSGTYGYTYKPQGSPPKEYRNEGPTGELVLIRLENNKYRFWLDINKGWPSYNMGDADGTIILDHDTATFDNTYEGAENKCIFTFKVSSTKVKITTSAYAFDCGFGNGVYADGIYTNNKKQQVLDNNWLRDHYSEHDAMVVTSAKAIIYEDKECLHPKKQYFIKGDYLPVIIENEESIYTEYIPSPGKFVYGWIKKSAIAIDKGLHK
jgi:hypothetical protein